MAQSQHREEREIDRVKEVLNIILNMYVVVYLSFNTEVKTVRVSGLFAVNNAIHPAIDTNLAV